MRRSRVVADETVYFRDDYASARALFRDSARGAGFTIETHPIEARGPDGAELTIDVALRGSESADHALVVSSGLHGVEGFFGSAVQSAWLCTRESSAGARVVLIHALNPYGFAHVRRVNEDNVDLNRNFMLEGQTYQGAHPAYHELARLLNPETPPERFDTFFVQALAPLARHGFRALKNAVAQGQYAYPRGLFFGGARPSKTQRILAEHFVRWVGSSRRALHVDLHTGRGASGHYALCVDVPPSHERARALEGVFGAGTVEGFDPSGVLYEMRGALGPWLAARVPDVRYDYLLAEFGTYHALNVLRALRAENRAHHQATSQATRERTKRALFEAFCPRSPRWRATVMARALTVLGQAEHALAV
jgi:hypothetical protein